jgi:DNA-binding CsgD family transcriptional regulator
MSTMMQAAAVAARPEESAPSLFVLDSRAAVAATERSGATEGQTGASTARPARQPGASSDPAARLEHEALTALAMDRFDAIAAIAAGYARTHPLGAAAGRDVLARIDCRRLLYAGALDQARRACRSVLDPASGVVASPATVALAQIVLARVATEQQSLAEAGRRVRAAAMAAAACPSPMLDQELRLARAHLAAAAGETSSALWWVMPALQHPGHWSSVLVLEPSSLPFIVKLAITNGNPDTVTQLLRWMADFAARASECPGVAISLRHATALLEQDAEALASVASAFGAGPRRLDEAAANDDAGRCFATAGEHVRASEHYERAARLYQIAGAQLGARRVRAELRELGEIEGPRRRATATFGWESLTDTELSVADLVTDGLTNRQVGEILFMSRFTVDSHLRHIFAKLGINSRVALASIVLQRRCGAEPA